HGWRGRDSSPVEARRCPGGRPRILLVRSSGAADLQGRPCGISPAPEADRRLHAGPCPCPARSEAGTQGDAAQPLGVGLRPDGSSVEYFKPVRCPVWMSADEYRKLPESIMVRELRYRITAPGFRTREVTLVTTLLDAAAYPADALAKLYGTRWRIEENLKSLKQTMKMDVLKCMTVDGVLKELTMYALAYNLVRVTMCQAAGRQGVEADRVSFIDALRWLRGAEEGEEMPELVVNPRRPGRYEPRVRKRRPKQYPVMKKPRAELRKLLRDKDLAA